MKHKIKIGLDLHGVINAKLNFFRILNKLLIENGHEVHIISGAQGKFELPILKKLKIPYTHFFSITDHHVKLGTPIHWDKKGRPNLDTYLWDKTKAEYCSLHGIDLHLDDSDIYQYFFKTPYGRFYGKDSDRVAKTRLG